MVLRRAASYITRCMVSTYIYNSSNLSVRIDSIGERQGDINVTLFQQHTLFTRRQTNTMIIKTPPSTTPTKRGTFILLEGIDRCGKTTQVSLLVKHLLSLSLATIAYRFPDRATPIGHLIDGYLKSSSEVDDRSIHLLFSANRWEKAKNLGEVLASGTNVVCDRYAYSGVAFTSAKRVDDEGSEGKGLGLKWCMGPDVGLPAPDCVIFLELGQEEAEKRGGWVDFRDSWSGFLFWWIVMFVASSLALRVRKYWFWGISLVSVENCHLDEPRVVPRGESKPEIHVQKWISLPKTKMPFYCRIRLSYFAIETVTGQILCIIFLRLHWLVLNWDITVDDLDNWAFFTHFPRLFTQPIPTTTTQRPITRQNYSNLSYGGERYEKRDLQLRVRKRFAELQSIDEKDGRVPWHVVDASQSIEEVTTELVKIVEETVEKVKDGKPLRKMWEDGVYDLPQVAGGLVEEKKEN